MSVTCHIKDFEALRKAATVVVRASLGDWGNPWHDCIGNNSECSDESELMSVNFDSTCIDYSRNWRDPISSTCMGRGRWDRPVIDHFLSSGNQTHLISDVLLQVPGFALPAVHSGTSCIETGGGYGKRNGCQKYSLQALPKVCECVVRVSEHVFSEPYQTFFSGFPNDPMSQSHSKPRRQFSPRSQHRTMNYDPL